MVFRDLGSNNGVNTKFGSVGVGVLNCIKKFVTPGKVCRLVNGRVTIMPKHGALNPKIPYTDSEHRC